MLVGRDGGRRAAAKTTMTSVSPPRAVSGAGLEVGGGAGGREVGGGFDDEDSNNGPHVPEETFLDSLHLDRDQMFDFSNSEGHFLYLRQKPGTDATAYNLEVSFFERF